VTKLLKSDTVPVYIDRYNENIGFVDIDAVLPERRIHNWSRAYFNVSRMLLVQLNTSATGAKRTVFLRFSCQGDRVTEWQGDSRFGLSLCSGPLSQRISIPMPHFRFASRLQISDQIPDFGRDFNWDFKIQSEISKFQVRFHARFHRLCWMKPLHRACIEVNRNRRTRWFIRLQAAF